MRFAILGSGAVGGYYGARLWQAGHDVTFIARGRHLDAIRQHGLEIKSPRGDVVARAAAVQDTATLGHVDCVVLATKTYDNASAVPMLAPIVGSETSVLTLQNGVDSVDECAAAVGRHAVLGGSVYVATAVEAPGLIVQTGTHQRVVFGEIAGAAGATLSPRVEAIRDALAGAGIEVEAVPDARVPLWEKFIYLAPFAGLTGASRLPIGGIWTFPVVQETFYEACREVERVARAEGVEVSRDTIPRIERYMAELPPSTRSSLLIDLQQGKRIEVEALQGSVVRRGRKAGVPTPIHAALYSVLKAYEHGPV
ncbi:MAG: 2-dehydropantoate 2-reductase [Vicinamibacterales bacterium]